MNVSDAKAEVGLSVSVRPSAVRVLNDLRLGVQGEPVRLEGVNLAYAVRMRATGAADAVRLDVLRCRATASAGLPQVWNGDGRDFEGRALTTATKIYGVLMETPAGNAGQVTVRASRAGFPEFVSPQEGKGRCLWLATAGLEVEDEVLTASFTASGDELVVTVLAETDGSAVPAVGPEAPVLESVAVANGAASTTTRSVALVHTWSGGTPTEYRAAETDDLSGVEWATWVETPEFTLSDGAGAKTVYVQLRNGTGSSSVVGDAVTYNPLPDAPVVETVSLNNGAASTTDRTVRVNHTLSGGTPEEYQVSEDAGFSGAVWTAYTAVPTLTVGEGDGTKTVYLRVRNAGGTSAAGSDTIAYAAGPSAPVLSAVSLDAGAAETTDRVVTLNHTASGDAATEYLASEAEDFAGASWETYAAAPEFTLSEGLGVKRVYVKLRNAGGESGVVSDTIVYAQDGSLEEVTEIQQHGVTWRFATPVQAGRTVTGEWYVLDTGGGVTVESVDPAPAAGRNGSMVNPEASPTAGGNAQGYDDRIAYYDAGVAVSFPRVLTAGESLVSTISLTDGDLVNGRYVQEWNNARLISPNFVHLKTAAVLTVVDTQLPADAYRPTFLGTTKTVYRKSDLVAAMSPGVPGPAGVELPNGIAYYERGLERPWLTHLRGFQARPLHPLENMPNYHEQVGTFLSEAAAILMTDLASETLRDRWVQVGIDQAAMVQQGAGDSALFEWQVIYTGLLLGDEDMARVFVDGNALTEGRAADKFYYWDTKESTIAPTAGQVTPGETWTGATVFFRKQKGNTEHEHLHPSEWGLVDNGGGRKQENYRQSGDSIPHLGMALASRMVGAEGYWAAPAVHDYLDRWMTEPWTSLYKPVVDSYWGGVVDNTQSMGSDWLDGMYELYAEGLEG